MKEWYLMTSNTRPNITGSFENDSFLDYRDDAFAESLMTEIASSVVLYNYDLSKFQNVRCIIQGNAANTQLKSMERTALFSHGIVKAGMYVFFEKRYWLVTGYPGYNGIYDKATLQLCQFKARWQNKHGKIIERWCYAASASKYDVGENGNNTIILSSNNLSLLLPHDNESIDLDGKRIFIDSRKINPTRVFKITRTDDVLYDYGEEHGGVLSFIADKTELNLEVDRPDLKICDYIAPKKPILPPVSNESPILFAKIVGNPVLKVGFPRTFIAEFFDKEKCKVNDVDFGWNVISDFEIQQTIEKDKIKLFVDDEALIGASFLLQMINSNNSVVAEATINIIEAF